MANVPDPRRFDTDPDQRNCAIGLRTRAQILLMPTQKLCSPKVPKVQINKLLQSHKTVEIKVPNSFLLLYRRIRIHNKNYKSESGPYVKAEQ
jgi:hypothetical protein